MAFFGKIHMYKILPRILLFLGLFGTLYPEK